METHQQNADPVFILAQIMKLITVLEQEQALLKRAAIDDLQPILEKRQQLLATITTMQDVITAELSDSTVKPGDDWLAIKSALERCRTLNSQNHQLARLGQQTVSQSLALLKELAGDNAGETYDDHGSKAHGGRRRRGIGIA